MAAVAWVLVVLVVSLSSRDVQGENCTAASDTEDHDHPVPDFSRVLDDGSYSLILEVTDMIKVNAIEICSNSLSTKKILHFSVGSFYSDVIVRIHIIVLIFRSWVLYYN